MPPIEKSSIEIRHDVGNHSVRISQNDRPAFRFEYDESGHTAKVERNGYDGWKEMKPEAAKNVVAFWEAFQCLP